MTHRLPCPAPHTGLRPHHWKQCSSTAQSHPCAQHWKPVLEMTRITSLNRTNWDRHQRWHLRPWWSHKVVSSSAVPPWHYSPTIYPICISELATTDSPNSLQHTERTNKAVQYPEESFHFHSEIRGILTALLSKYQTPYDNSPDHYMQLGISQTKIPPWCEVPKGQHVVWCMTKPFFFFSYPM